MKLLYSEKGKPYIQLDESKLIFSEMTAGPNGFKFLVFSGVLLIEHRIKKAGKFTTFEVLENKTFLTNMKLDKIPRDVKKNSDLTSFTTSYLKKKLKKYVKDDYFPFESLEAFGKELDADFNEDEDFIEDDPTATESYDDI